MCESDNKVGLVHAMKTWGSADTGSVILNLGMWCRSQVSLMMWPLNLQRKHPCNQLNVRSGWPPESVWMLQRREKFLSPSRSWTIIYLLSSLQLNHYIDCATTVITFEICMFFRLEYAFWVVLDIRKLFITASPSIDKSDKW
jgi:hypothetical protein